MYKLIICVICKVYLKELICRIIVDLFPPELYCSRQVKMITKYRGMTSKMASK